MLDQGAAGVMLPRLDSAAEVAAAIRHLRYPPEGDRGVATYNRACRFGLDPAALDRANTEVLAVVQIESARAVEQVAEIAALDGVDVLFVGPRDLSHDLGVPGDMQAPSYLEALDRVRSAAQQFGKSCGLLVPDWGSSSGEALRRAGRSWPSAPTPPCWPQPSQRSSPAPGPQRSVMTSTERRRQCTTQHDIGVGLISVGWMGKLHTRAYLALPTVYPELGLRPRLVHAVDTAPDRAEYAREILGYAKASTDYRDVLADPDVDVVSICAPTGLHREIGVAAAEAGKPFWIEKPVGRDAKRRPT